MSTTDGSADGFDLHQGWIQLENTPGIGGRTRVGRQAIAFGDQRLIGSLEWASQGRAFDGALQTWHDAGEYHRLHALFLQVGDAGASTMHEDAFLAGLYYTLLGIDDGELDFYALLLDDEETIAGGNHDRVTLGSRWDQRFGDMQFGAELATQVGQMDGADIPFGETFAAHAHATLHIEDSSLWVRGEVNLASGDDPSTTDNERFNTLFPTAHAHLGIMDFALWENLFHGMAQVGFDCCESSSLTASWSFFRSMEETDAFRGPGGRTLSAGGVGFSNTMGNEIDLVFTRRFDTAPAKTSIQIGYGLFLPGAGAVDANGNDDLAHFAYVQGDLRF